jgi:hypothetical protein
MKRFNAVLLVLLVAALLVFFYVWPGVYRYKYYTDGVERVDILTGQLFELQPGGGWLVWDPNREVD